jgi:hypothetical protein
MKNKFKILLLLSTSVFPIALVGGQALASATPSISLSNQAIVKKLLSTDIAGNIGTFNVDVPNDNAILASAKNTFPSFHNEGSG